MIRHNYPHLLPHIIENSAEKYPDKTVFRFDDRALTYAELNARTNSLAHLLVELGVRRGDRVGIYLHKSMETAIALFGIMKAGAAYVPLDPALPQNRLEQVIQDCGIRHLVSQRMKMNRVIAAAADLPQLHTVIGPDSATRPDHSSLQVIPWSDVYQLPDNAAPDISGLTGHDLAYIMYTSGSTGTPKGLMHTHDSGLSYAQAAAALYNVQPTDMLGNHSPLHFDMSTFDFFSGPLAGATTSIIPEEYKMLPASLAELIEEEQMTIWYSVTTALVELLLHGLLSERDLSSLRWVLFGGEPFPPAHLTALMELLPGTRFSNVYGPAEVNQCTYYHVPPLPNQYNREYVPIGKVWEIADWLILNEEDQEVAPGDIGELLICAPTRMQGYWNQPELTERGFYRQRPFPGSRYERIFYRTGDLVQLDDQGALKFLGRKDRQIKVRGYRVELDEIEAVLSAQPAVGETAVYTLPTPDDNRRIEAAIVLREGATATADELRQFVAAQLPFYAVPDSFVFHEQFPRTGSGKIDRRALQAMAQPSSANEQSRPELPAAHYTKNKDL